MDSERLDWDDLPNPDQAATGDGRMVAASVNALTIEVNRLRLDLRDLLSRTRPSQDAAGDAGRET